MTKKVMMRICIILSLFITLLTFSGSNYCYGNQGGEKYIIKEVAFIPWGEEDSLLGFIPSGVDTNELGETTWVEPGEAVKDWDIGLDGKIYIVDGVKKRISVYDSDGHYLKSIGTLSTNINKIAVTTTSGEEKIIYPYYPGRYDPLKNLTIPFPYKTYFEFYSGVAVDGNGNIYVNSSWLMKFSPEGKLLEIIDQFGEYKREDIKGIGFDIRSNSIGHIFVGMITKSGQRIFAEFNDEGEYIATTKNRIHPRDTQGNIYDMLPDGKSPLISDKKVSFSIRYSLKTKSDSITIYFGSPTARGVIFRGVDGDGNIYLDVGWALHKYDRKGNLLAIIQGKPDTKRTLTQSITGMGKISKLMANGDIYVAYMCDQGFVVVKQELQQETKGQILKPAVKSK
jgi:hypothetical protein